MADLAAWIPMESARWRIALVVMPSMTLLRLGTQKEVRTFSRLDHGDQRFAFSERYACLRMRGDDAHECTPPLVSIQLIGIDKGEATGSTEGNTAKNKDRRTHRVSPYRSVRPIANNNRAGGMFPERVIGTSREHAESRRGNEKPSLYAQLSPLLWQRMCYDAYICTCYGYICT